MRHAFGLAAAHGPTGRRIERRAERTALSHCCANAVLSMRPHRRRVESFQEPQRLQGPSRSPKLSPSLSSVQSETLLPLHFAGTGSGPPRASGWAARAGHQAPRRGRSRPLPPRKYSSRASSISSITCCGRARRPAAPVTAYLSRTRLSSRMASPWSGISPPRSRNRS